MSGRLIYVPVDGGRPGVPDHLEVFDVERDSNGERPCVRVFRFHPATPAAHAAVLRNHQR